MARSVHLFNFFGVAPKIDSSLINASGAMIAENVNLSRGDIEPIRAGTAIGYENFNIRTLVDVDGYGIQGFNYETDVIFGNPTDRDLGMMYWIDDRGKVIYGTRSDVMKGAWLYLGTPPPTVGPITPAPLEDDPDKPSNSCFIPSSFCFTNVNKYGDESQPSPVSSTKPFNKNGVRLELPDAPHSWSRSGITRRRAYRSVPSLTSGAESAVNAGGEWVFVGEFSASDNSIMTLPIGQGVGVLPSVRWAIPPDQEITSISICPLSNTLMLGAGNVVYISHPGQYHAFPRDRDIVLQDNIVALRNYSNLTMCLTDGHPYVFTAIRGDDGASMYEVDRADEPYPCLSKKSVAVGTSGVIWSSTDGLFVFTKTKIGITVQSLTSQLFHADDWNEIGGNTIRGETHNGAYYFTSDRPLRNVITGHKSFTWVLTFDQTVFDYPTNIQLVSVTGQPDLWYRTRKDKLYFTMGYGIYEWNPHNGVPFPYIYSTRDIVEGGLTNYSAAKVVHDADGDLQFELWAERGSVSRLIYSRDLTHSEPFRLPRCLLNINYYVKLIGTSRVRHLHLADSLVGLTNTRDTTFDNGNTRLTSR